MSTSSPVNTQEAKEHCSYCEVASEGLLKCGRCLTALYCSPEHQKAHWKAGHKKNCFAPNDIPPPLDADAARPGEGQGMDLAKAIAHRLRAHGYAVVDNLLGASVAGGALSEAKALKESGRLAPGELAGGKTGKGVKYNVKNVRGDEIRWVDTDEDPDGMPSVTCAVEAFDQWALALNAVLPGLNLTGRTKTMVTCYPGDGTRYVKHADNPDNDGRKMTIVYYLNRGWDPAKDGGKLRIYNPSATVPCNPLDAEKEGCRKVDVDPLFDRAIIFWSDKRILHEVMPSHAHRYAMTCWYFGEERAHARLAVKDDEDSTEYLVERKKLMDEKNAAAEELRAKIARLQAERDEIKSKIAAKEGSDAGTGAVEPAMMSVEEVRELDANMPASEAKQFAAAMSAVLDAMETQDPDARAEALVQCNTMAQGAGLASLRRANPAAVNMIELTIKIVATGSMSGKTLDSYMQMVCERVGGILGEDHPVAKRLTSLVNPPSSGKNRTTTGTGGTVGPPMFDGVSFEHQCVFQSIVQDLAKIASVTCPRKRKSGHQTFSEMMMSSSQCTSFLDACPGLAFLIMRVHTLLHSLESEKDREEHAAELQTVLRGAEDASNADQGSKMAVARLASAAQDLVARLQ